MSTISKTTGRFATTLSEDARGDLTVRYWSVENQRWLTAQTQRGISATDWQGATDADRALFEQLPEQF